MIAHPASMQAALMLADARYARLDDAHKDFVEARVAMMQRIDAAPGKQQAFVSESRRTHAGECYSRHTIRKLYYDKWLASGRDWWAMRDAARIPEQAASLPPDFVQHWLELCYEHGGKHKAAWRVLKRQWERGEKIKGYEDLPWSPELPRGLSYENLMKSYRPSDLQDRVAGIGLGAAFDLLPGTLTTRAGLKFGARWVFDDIWHDFKVNVPGQLGARRLLQFHCIELLSACQAARGMKPEILNDRSGRMERLTERELLFLLAHVVCTLGYNPDGCIMMMEHGTANVREAAEKILYDGSGRKILVERGAISGSPLAPGLYAGRGRGNFKFKAALESLGNLIHNELSSRLELPANTGSNSRVNAPEVLHGIEKHHDALVQAMAALPAELHELVRLPATPLWRAIAFADQVQEEINRRTDHDLEGWATCGFEMSEYRIHPAHPWSPMTQLKELAPALRSGMEMAISQDARLSRQRQLSPREVFDGYRHQLTRLPMHLLPRLVGMEYAKERAAAKDGQFHFDDMELGPDEHHYDGLVYKEDGSPVRLSAGEKYATFVSTIDPTRMHLCDAKGAWVGWVNRTLVPSKGDARGFARAQGAKMKAHQEMLAPVLAAARPIIKQQADNAAHNDTVFEAALGRRQQPAPKAEERARQNRRAKLDATLAQARRRNQEAAAHAQGGLYD